MYCSKCNWDYPTDPDFELTGQGICSGCGSKYGVYGSQSILGDDGHHETGSDAGEGDALLNEVVGDDRFDW
jgi:hypothetical protein